MTDMPAAPASRPALEEWLLSVVEAFDVEPRLRRVVFTADSLDQLDYRPGQALVLRMPLPEGGTGRRDYTIRWLDRSAKRLAIDFVLHGATPAPSWARAAQAGHTLLAHGPRGRTVVAPAADWHLFVDWLEADPRRVKRVRIYKLKERRERPRDRSRAGAEAAAAAPPPATVPEAASTEPKSRRP